MWLESFLAVLVLTLLLTLIVAFIGWLLFKE
jgi:hypothetical protein